MRTRRRTRRPTMFAHGLESAVPCSMFGDAADHFIAVLDRLRICRSERTGEIRAPCRNRRVGWDASGFCERAKYSDALEARSRGRHFSEPPCGVSQCDDGKRNGHGDRCLSRQERYHCEPCLSTRHRFSPYARCRSEISGGKRRSTFGWKIYFSSNDCRIGATHRRSQRNCSRKNCRSFVGPTIRVQRDGDPVQSSVTLFAGQSLPTGAVAPITACVRSISVCSFAKGFLDDQSVDGCSLERQFAGIFNSMAGSSRTLRSMKPRRERRRPSRQSSLPMKISALFSRR